MHNHAVSRARVHARCAPIVRAAASVGVAVSRARVCARAQGMLRVIGVSRAAFCGVADDVGADRLVVPKCGVHAAARVGRLARATPW